MSAVKQSKLLSLVLRHKPETIGVTLDEAGWVDVDTLLTAMARNGHDMSRAILDQVVTTNDKKRFEFSPDGSRIRARQGHSVSVELGYDPATPPARLYHGTVARALPGIRAEGLTPGSRHHVHLSPDTTTATRVGQRRGEPVILEVDAAAMHAAGHTFFHTENDVWLTAAVPAAFITFPAGA